MSVQASIIIPTHNRAASVTKLVNSLSRQQHSPSLFEVIVVADGCTDNTVDVIAALNTSFPLQVYTLPGSGAAAARNHGASMAKGDILIFLDDDMLPCDAFISEHLSHHHAGKDVVIGYSPLQLEANGGWQRKILREWWEKKFGKMRDPRHRFRYDDLTSGNFSISAQWFGSLGGFDTSLLCREDYEFGFRLIRAGAQFHFAEKAKAFHCDAVTTLARSLQRKKMEGMADIQIETKHPDFINSEAIFYVSQRSSYKKILLAGIQVAPGLVDALAALGLKAMTFYERWNLRNAWMTSSYRLHQYWYLRGLMQNSGSFKQLRRLLFANTGQLNPASTLTINLANGLDAAEDLIAQHRPAQVKFVFGEKEIGELNEDPGAEPLKPEHLRHLLRERFAPKLADVLVKREWKTK